MRYKCEISYDGSKFHGFQSQSNLRCVQSEFEKVLAFFLKENITIYASGRTDSLVHALGQVIHFNSSRNLSAESMKKAINTYLPKDIHVNSVNIVDESFHARYSTHKKEYHYLVDFGEYNPLYANYRCYYFYDDVDLNKVIDASKIFIGKHDFKSFCKSSNKINTIREIYSIDFDLCNNLLTVKIIGNGFLHNQIRIMIAMLFEVGRGKINKEQLKSILEQKNRKLAPKVLDACGLYLYKVYY